MVLKSLQSSSALQMALSLDEGIQIQIKKANRGPLPMVIEKGYFILLEVGDSMPLSPTTYVQVMTTEVSEYSNIFPLRGTQIQIFLPQDWAEQDEFFKNASILDAFISQSLKLSDAIHSFIHKFTNHKNDRLSFWASFYGLLSQLKSSFQESEQLPSNDQAKLEEIAKLLSSNFSIPQPKVSELALKVGLSAAKLKVLFKKTYGESLYQFHQRAKMAYAAELIQTQRYTISQVSYKVGYNHCVKFINIFKKHFGVTPGEFKKLFDSGARASQ